VRVDLLSSDYYAKRLSGFGRPRVAVVVTPPVEEDEPPCVDEDAR
jgi:hypothetical protein